MLLPTTFPSARSASPFIADITLTASSGALVPKATTVSPTTSGEMPIAEARLAAPLTRNSAPATSKKKAKQQENNCGDGHESMEGNRARRIRWRAESGRLHHSPPDHQSENSANFTVAGVSHPLLA